MSCTFSKNSTFDDRSASYFDRRAPSYHIDSLRWPWSWLRAREAEAIDLMLGDVAGADMLDFGCGAGYYARLYITRNPQRMVAVDLSRAMIGQITDKRIECEVGNAALIKIEGKFDKIISAGLLEFVDDGSAVLANARRLARDGAQLVVLVPRRNLAGKAYRRFHKRNGIDIDFYNLDQLQEMAATTGWTMTDNKSVFPFSLAASFETSKAPGP